MKPIIRQLLTPPNYSFIAEEHYRAYFNVPWHVHDEYELIIVLNSTGKRYVGDSIEDFRPGDIVLVGPNTPHCWLNEKLSRCSGKNFNVHYLIIQFKHDFMGVDFFNKPEMGSINHFLQKASYGIRIEGDIVDHTIKSVMNIIKTSSVNRLVHFLHLLDDFSSWEQIRLLSSPFFVNAGTATSADIQIVHKYILENMKKKITLQQMASHMNMSISGFCKFFKKRMKKPFVSFVNEFRIGYACRLLRETNTRSTEICYESGFENYSNFFRQFKKIKGISPEEYRAGQTHK